jgi:hypothetical protein
VTGEPEAALYLEHGQFRLAPDDTVVIYTDGFRPYLASLGFRKMLASFESERLLGEYIHRITEEHTTKLRRMLRDRRIDSRASTEIIEAKLRQILGRRFRETEWAKEKSLIAVKVL